MRETVPEPSRPFEVELGCGLLHVLADNLDELVAVPREETLAAPDVLGVLLLRAGTAAGTRAEPDMIIEAGLVIWLGTRLELAGQALVLDARRLAQRHDLAHGVDHVARCTGIGIGSEVPGTGTMLLAGVLDRGERVVLDDRDEGIALVVTVVGIERR